MIQITDPLKLLDPMGQPCTEVPIRVEVIKSDYSPKGAVGKVATGSDGSYNFQLVEGILRIEVKYSDEYVVTGEVLIDTNTPNTLTLPKLLGDYTYVPEVTA